MIENHDQSPGPVGRPPGTVTEAAAAEAAAAAAGLSGRRVLRGDSAFQVKFFTGPLAL